MPYIAPPANIILSASRWIRFISIFAPIFLGVIDVLILGAKEIFTYILYI